MILNTLNSDDVFSSAINFIENPPLGTRIPDWKIFSDMIGGMRGKEFTIFCGATGCLSGASQIPINRAKKGFTISIQELYERSHGIGQNCFDEKIPTFVRSFNGETIQLQKIKNVFLSGIKKTWRLNTDQKGGLRLTGCHRIYTQRGWVRAENLIAGDFIAMDSGKPSKMKNRKSKVYDSYFGRIKFHPFSTKCNHERRIVKHRAIFEAQLNGVTLEEFLFAIRSDESQAKLFSYVDPSTHHVHHKDQNHFNNDPENLVAIKILDHFKIHGDEQNFNQGQLRWCKFLGLDTPSEEAVYDIECEDPHHNFVANGLVVHNSGKTQFLANMAAHLALIGKKIFVASVETGSTDFAVRMLSGTTGHDFNTGDKPTIPALKSLVETMTIDGDKFKNNLIFSKHENRVEVSEMIETLQYMHDVRNVEFAILDNINFFLKPTSQNNAMIEMDSAIHEFVMLAKEIPIHIVLVMHPKKGQGSSTKIMNEFDIKGSSTAVQEATNVLLMNRMDEKDEGYKPTKREFVFCKIRKRGFNVGRKFFMEYVGGKYVEDNRTVENRPRIVSSKMVKTPYAD